ncbi:MAG: substrate-binding domain-containing protein [Treponema sp.]|nr:substrate-binding domain-containing protein [Treponema sp.]
MQKTISFRIILFAALLSALSFGLVPGLGAQSSRGVPIKGTITLSTTTSTQDSGLLNYLLPVFTQETGWQVKTIAVGTGAALKMGQDGDADVLLVHAKADEIKFVQDGFGVRRYDVMYNDFLIVGPDQKAIRRNANVIQTLKDIASKNLPFVSRGDDSGTHRMELSLWRAAGLDVRSLGRYTSAGQGMGATLQMAYELKAYTLTDRATWLTQSRNKRIVLPAVCEKATDLLNYYGVIAVNPVRHPRINAAGGQAFAEWMIKDSTQKLIGNYGKKEFGQALFTPNAKANK